MNATIVVALVAVVVVLGLFFWRMRGGLEGLTGGGEARRVARMRQQFQRLAQIPSNAVAERELERQLADLRARQPGKSTEWYLQKILYDLQRHL